MTTKLNQLTSRDRHHRDRKPLLMKTILKIKLALAMLLAIAGVTFLPATARSDDPDPVIHIIGGSTGAFVATPHSLTTSGYTDFAANIKCYANGTATGEFACAIPNVVVLAVVPGRWEFRSDGSVKVFGNEYGYDVVGGAGFTDCPAWVVFRAGGKGVGGFDFKDCVFPQGTFDTEVVRFGRIDIRRN
jgi:hypothetical protein